MANIEVLDGFRYRYEYFGLNLYMVITPESMDIHLEERDAKKRTLVSMDIISSLVTMLLEECDAEPDRIAGAIWENSRNKGDLADILSMAITEAMSKLTKEEVE